MADLCVRPSIRSPKQRERRAWRPLRWSGGLPPKSVCAVATATVLFPMSSALAGPLFTGLGDLSEGSGSIAREMSADGSVVVGASGDDAFLWTAEAGMVGLGALPGGSSSRANGVSADGSVVVGFSDSASGRQAFRWTAGTGMVGLGDLPAAGSSFDSVANAVSADGSVVVGDGSPEEQLDPLPTEAFRWTADGGMAGLGALSGAGLEASNARGVSADGSIVVGTADSDLGFQAYRWTEEGGMIGLGQLPVEGFTSGLSEGRGVSADGSVVVGTSLTAFDEDTEFEAFRWTAAGGIVGLGDLAGGIVNSVANDVSGDGSVVVGRGESAVGDEAFVWDASNGLRSLRDVLSVELGLDLTGWILTEAEAISDDGLTIVGTGIDPGGDTEAWIAVIPEPGTALLLGGGLVAMGVRRQRPA